jgi:tubulin beta
MLIIITDLNWAKGYYTEGREYLGEVLDVVRRAIERCDSFQGFQLVHSIGGGCGSGFGSLLYEKLYEIYPDKVLCNFAYLPNVRGDTVVIEPYNTLLSMAHMLENSSMMMFFEETAMYDICRQILSSPRVPQDCINSLMSSVMADITCSFRFPSQVEYRERRNVN